MYCINCGKTNDKGVYFCKNCSYNLYLEENIRENKKREEKENELKKMKYSKLFTTLTIIFGCISSILAFISLITPLIYIAAVISFLALISSLIAMFIFNSTRLNLIPGFLPLLISIIIYLI